MAIDPLSLHYLPLPHNTTQQVVGTFHGAPLLDVPGTGPVEIGFELLVATTRAGLGSDDAGPGPVAVAVPRVGIVLEAVGPAEREEDGEEAGGMGDDEEQSLPSLPPHVVAAVAVGAQQQPPPVQQQPPPVQQQHQLRAPRRRLEGEELLRALGCVLPRLMWH